MPFGFGLHPWFHRAPETILTFSALKFWLEGPGHIATEPIAVPPDLNFESGRQLPPTWLNNGYAGWNGAAEIRYPADCFGVRIEADPVFGHLMLFSDPQLSRFALEPQTCSPCAFNKLEILSIAELGVVVLPPGSQAHGTVTFIPFEF